MESYHDDRISFEIKDGIIYCTFHVEYMDYKLVDEAIKKRLELVKDGSYPMLSDLSKVKGISKEARERMSEEDGLIGLPAMAGIYRTKFQMIVISIYEMIYTPKVPSKYFKNREKALAWLQQFK